jgi:folate-binding protein YgfZ
LTHLQRYVLGDDVQLHTRSDQFGELFLSGPNSAAILARCADCLATLGKSEHATTKIGSSAGVVRRVDWFQQPGFLISTDRKLLAELWRELTDQGAQPGGAQAFHALRIEAGFPLYGLDLSGDNLAHEAARTAAAISFTKGCYLGQEPIARLESLGHVNRQLCRLQVESTPASPADPAVRDREGDSNVGAVTSWVPIPGADRAVALAMLRTTHSIAGTKLWIATGSDQVAATVV